MVAKPCATIFPLSGCCIIAAFPAHNMPGTLDLSERVPVSESIKAGKPDVFLSRLRCYPGHRDHLGSFQAPRISFYFSTRTSSRALPARLSLAASAGGSTGHGRLLLGGRVNDKTAIG